MTHSNLSYRCYILPTVAAIVYFILSLPPVVSVFNDWIPDYYYSSLVKSLLLLMILFLTCRILDICWADMCHDGQCTNSLNTICMTIATSETQLKVSDNHQDLAQNSTPHNQKDSTVNTPQHNRDLTHDNYHQDLTDNTTQCLDNQDNQDNQDNNQDNDQHSTHEDNKHHH